MEVISIERSTYEVIGFAASLVEEHPTLSHQPFHDSTSGAARPLVACYQRDARKVNISFESSNGLPIIRHQKASHLNICQSRFGTDGLVLFDANIRKVLEL